MRLLHLYGGNVYGGVERLLATLAELRGEAPEIEQTFGLCHRARLWRELEQAGAAVHDLGPVRASRPWQLRQARERLRAWLRRHPVEVALCHSWWAHAVFAPALADTGIAAGLWAHNAVHAGPWHWARPSVHAWLEAWSARQHPHFAVALSAGVAGCLRQRYPDVPILVWRPPVRPAPPLDGAGLRRVRTSCQTGERAFVILQASRLEAMKGHALLLEALARLPAGAEWVVWFTGGPQRPQERQYLRQLQAQAARLGLEARVRWLGERGDVGALMRAADIFCHPTTQPEPFGLVIAEALAAGLPVVATRGGGPSEMLEPACGVLTPPAAVDLAAALQLLRDDAPLRARMAAAAPARARRLCDPSTQMRAWQTAMLEHSPASVQAVPA